MHGNNHDSRPPFDPIGFIVCTALTAVLTSVVVGTPFAVLFCHRFLSSSSSRLASILGVASSGMLFGIPAPVLIVVLVVSLVMVDATVAQSPLSSLFLRVSLASVLSAAGILTVLAYSKGATLAGYWFAESEAISLWVGQYVEASVIAPPALLMALRYQLPFALVSTTLLSIWFAVGLAAHFSWFGEGHSLSAPELRTKTFGWWILCGLIVVMVLRFLMRHDAWGLIFGGLENIFLVLLFCQGCIAFSVLLAKRNITHRCRTFWFLVFSSVGFYVAVAMGIVRILRPALCLLRREKNESHFA